MKIQVKNKVRQVSLEFCIFLRNSLKFKFNLFKLIKEV